jgi:hypothetical protein
MHPGRNLILNRPANGSATQALITFGSPHRRIAMSTHQDAKAMAKSLRDSMARRKVSLSHAECLEIVAQQFGFADWNTLSAKLYPSGEHGNVFCSFCDKSKHEVRVLAEGGCRSRNKPSSSCVFICDECVAFCSAVFADRTGNALGAG